MAYRKDIEGLRAISVSAVVIYHVAPNLIPGGFAGVDVFFVISGYLITSILVRQMESQTFSFIEFYRRRVQRLGPALCLVTAATLGIAYAIYGPVSFENLSKSVVAAVLIHANHYFLRDAGYFAATPETTPLLHLWSLSVEEQFYLLYPAILFVTHRLRWSTSKVVAALALLSFLASCWAVYIAPEHAFFLLPFRAWEMLLGAVIVLQNRAPASENAAVAYSSLGGVLLILSFGLLSQNSAFPGWGALAPCIGAGLILFAGGGGYSPSVLHHHLVVHLGRISYSLYLWHWPVICFWIYLYGPLGVLGSFTTIALSLVLAEATHRLLEAPARAATMKSVVTGGTLASLATILSLSLWIDQQDGVRSRLPAPWNVSLGKESLKVGGEARECSIAILTALDPRMAAPHRPSLPSLCRIGKASTPSVVLWGDSHALALVPALSRALEETDRSAYVVSRASCPPIPNLHTGGWRNDECLEFNRQAIEYIKWLSPSEVILAARWPLYDGHGRIANEAGAPVATSGFGTIIPAEALEAGLFGVVKTLNDITGVRVSIVMPTPEMGYHVSDAAATSVLLGKSPIVRTPLTDVLERQDVSRAMLQRLRGFAGVRLIDPLPVLCSDGVDCIASTVRQLYYSDNNHLTVAGAERLSPLFKPALASRPVTRGQPAL